MPIVADFGPDVEEYIELEKQHHCPQPDSCPHCGVTGEVIGHGYYVRKPKGLERGWVLRVKRWKCKACGKTVGAVPSFLLFYRHYLLAIIQDVVVGRFELGYSWARVDVLFSANGTPSRRTQQRWCAGFGEYAQGWLAALEQVLADQDSRSAWLDAQGEAQQASNLPQALLQASLHLLAWAKGRWQELEGFVLNDRLRWLWFWGNRQAGLTRLA